MKVFYNKNQSVDISKMNLFSPSAGKPEKVIQDWEKKGYPIEIVSNFDPLSEEEISLVHNPSYVKRVLSGKCANGFGTYHKAIRESLPWTTGSIVAASLHALESGEVTMSPTSGFHHAGYSFGQGFCTFNGTMIAVAMAVEKGAKKVGIVDYDQHFQNGNQDIIDKVDFGIDIPMLDCPSPKGLDDYLEILPHILESMFEGCDLILYGAGADSHISDPLGHTFDTDQFRLRDKIVFETFKKMNIPVSWALFGGYQSLIQKVLDLHSITLEECLKVNYKGDCNDQKKIS